jgi:hypothetical protein
MKTLFSKRALSSKPDTSIFFPLFPYSGNNKGIRGRMNGEYPSTKGTFKNKGLIKNHYMLFISRA